MIKDLEKIVALAKAVCPKTEIVEHREQLTLLIPQEFLIDMAIELKENAETSFDQLLDITAIDWMKPHNRFEVVYNFWSNKNKSRVRVKVPVDESHLNCPTLTKVYESANWYERETFDMYGIKFTGHPNLRRFYMPEDFVDPESGESLFPLRKDFPLMGVPDSMPLPPYPEKYGDIQ